jgi:hypothetical protein
MLTPAEIMVAAEIVKALGKLAVVGIPAISGALQAIFGGSKSPEEIAKLVQWLASDATFRMEMAKKDAGLA